MAIAVNASGPGHKTCKEFRRDARQVSQQLAAFPTTAGGQGVVTPGSTRRSHRGKMATKRHKKRKTRGDRSGPVLALPGRFFCAFWCFLWLFLPLSLLQCPLLASFLARATRQPNNSCGEGMRAARRALLPCYPPRSSLTAAATSSPSTARPSCLRCFMARPVACPSFLAPRKAGRIGSRCCRMAAWSRVRGSNFSR